jgi:hypothetical protein
MRRHVISLIWIQCLLGLGICAGQAAPQAPVPRVDARVELLSIVFRLAGNFEYNMDKLPGYSTEIDRYFAPYKNHPAVQMAHEFAKKKAVGFDAVMSMAISLSAPPELKPLVTFTPTVPEERWGVADAEKFLPLLRDFYRDSKFADFYAAHQPLFRMAEERFAETLGSVNFGWYPSFYGNAPNLTYHLILGLNNGHGNYGPRLFHSDGSMELFSIIGCWTHDDAGNPTYPKEQDYLARIIHEFNHSFVNPAVAVHWSDFSGADQVYTSVAEQMQRIGYVDAQTMVNESLVRAAVIVYFQQNGEESRKNLERIRQEQQLGFFWVDRLVDLLKLYDAQRAQYPTFSAYIPHVGLFYRDLAAHASEEAKVFDAKCAHVLSIEPFANHAQNVAPSIETITIVLDKPLDPNAGYSIDPGMDGNDHYPITGKPQFDGGGLHILLPVHLQPNQAYSFVLTPLTFATPAGYPLESYKVEFKTK